MLPINISSRTVRAHRGNACKEDQNCDWEAEKTTGWGPQRHRLWELSGTRDQLYWLIIFKPTALSSVQFSHSVMSNSLWPHGLQHTSFPVFQHLLELTQSHVHWVGDVIQPSHPLLSPSPPAFNLSQHQGLFQWVSSLHQVAKVLELQLQHQSFQWYSGLISLRIYWFHLLVVQGTLKSLLQHHSSKTSILWCSAFFIVQLSYLYLTNGKTIAFTDLCQQSNASAFQYAL